MADQALACLDMMDFGGKEGVMQKIAENGGMMHQMMQMQQQMLMLAQMVDQQRGSNLAEQIAAGITGAPVPAAIDGNANLESVKAANGEAEPANTKKARQRVAESTSPV
jgi:hypothetical protein